MHSLKPTTLKLTTLKLTTLKKATYSLAILLGCAISIGCADKSSTDTHTEESHEDHEHKKDTHEEHSKHEDHSGHEHEEHEEGIKHVGKHVHGEAELTAIVDGKALILEINSPAMNVFGFEHEPSTDEQKATVETQEILLNDGNKLFIIDGGECAVSDVEVDIPFEETHGEHEHGNEEHAEEATHAEQEHEGHEHKSEVHSDVTATYTYSCQDSASIKGITVNVFSNFTGFTKLNTRWVNGDKQGATTLTKERYTISF